MKMVLVTGLMRSGTTLLQKLLAAQPEIAVYSQPLPLLFVETKARYLRSVGREAPEYPIADQFQGTYFSSSDFSSFLQAYHIDRNAFAAILDQQRTYSGQRTEPPYPLSEPHRTSLAGWLRRTLTQLAEPRPSARVAGAKEVCCEEFIPYLLGEGFHIVQIVRDPRDVLASSIAGSGSRDVGRPRPPLFLLRQWRKSVAYALEFEGHPRYCRCRFEDLVTAPESTLYQLESALGVQPPTSRDRSQPLDLDGRPWTSNSSYQPRRGLDRAAIGRYRQALDPEVTRWVESLVLPEMLCLGYEPTLSLDDAIRVLERKPEQAEVPVRRELSEYRWTDDRRTEELGRLRQLREGTFDEASFIYLRAFQRLRTAKPMSTP